MADHLIDRGAWPKQKVVYRPKIDRKSECWNIIQWLYSIRYLKHNMIIHSIWEGPRIGKQKPPFSAMLKALGEELTQINSAGTIVL